MSPATGQPAESEPEPEPVTADDEDPTERADDGMAPLIANTGDDDGPGDDAGAPTG